MGMGRTESKTGRACSWGGGMAREQRWQKTQTQAGLREPLRACPLPLQLGCGGTVPAPRGRAHLPAPRLASLAGCCSAARSGRSYWPRQEFLLRHVGEPQGPRRLHGELDLVRTSGQLATSPTAPSLCPSQALCRLGCSSSTAQLAEHARLWELRMAARAPCSSSPLAANAAMGARGRRARGQGPTPCSSQGQKRAMLIGEYSPTPSFAVRKTRRNCNAHAPPQASALLFAPDPLLNPVARRAYC